MSSAMKIEVLGVGCDKCNRLYALAEEVLRDEGLAAELVKVEQLDEILKRGVMMVPGLVIDGHVKSSGSLPKAKQLAKWFRQAAQARGLG